MEFLLLNIKLMSLLNFILTAVAFAILFFFPDIIIFGEKNGMTRKQAILTFLGYCVIVLIIRIFFLS